MSFLWFHVLGFPKAKQVRDGAQLLEACLKMKMSDPASLFHSVMEAIEIEAACEDCGEVSFEVLRGYTCPYCSNVESSTQL
jgi:Zn finger protein HypA/HybF involved in hydrogenase expression